MSITEAREDLAAVLDRSKLGPVLLTRHGRVVAAVVDPYQLARLQADSEVLADARAADEAWSETERLGEAPVP